MPVTDVVTDPENLTIAIVAEFAAPVERLWQAYTDPRQLERFWGPPTWPARFTSFDLTVGGHAYYEMRGPHGEAHHAAWEFLRIDEPSGFEVLDYFADEHGNPVADMPEMRMVMSFEATENGSRMRSTSYFSSAESLETSLQMGVVEGTRMAMNQLDLVLQDLRDYALGKGTQVEIISDQLVRITRLIRGTREQVWRAHHEPELLKKWLLGPDGWRMTVCEVDSAVGGRYRYAWAPEEGTEGQEFGFDGETLVSEPPVRAVTTEHMTGTDYPATLNDMSLYEEDGYTLLTVVVEYPDAQTRDTVLATGMADGMETSYARLEGLLA